MRKSAGAWGSPAPACCAWCRENACPPSGTAKWWAWVYRLTFCRKFLGDMSAGKMVLDADLIYYRAALAVMMDAELKYYRKDYGGALKSLNIIAKRAYGKDDYYTDASQEAVLEALVDEYFLEFPAEGVIWWALIRLDKIWDYNDYLAANRNNTNILLWPISKSARDKNSNLTQTEGWY